MTRYAPLSSDTQFFDAHADDWQRFEIVGLIAALNLVELETSIMARVIRKVAKALERVAEKPDRTHRLIISDRI